MYTIYSSRTCPVTSIVCFAHFSCSSTVFVGFSFSIQTVSTICLQCCHVASAITIVLNMNIQHIQQHCKVPLNFIAQQNDASVFFSLSTCVFIVAPNYSTKKKLKVQANPVQCSITKVTENFKRTIISHTFYIHIKS